MYLVASQDLNEIYKKLTGEDLSTAPEIPVSPEIDTEISNCIMKNSGGNQLVENDLMEKIFIRVILLKLKKR